MERLVLEQIHQEDADFEGSVKFKTYSENVETLDISSGAVVVDLSLGQTFELTVDEGCN